jgi:hypothetical protein
VQERDDRRNEGRAGDTARLRARRQGSNGIRRNRQRGRRVPGDRDDPADAMVVLRRGDRLGRPTGRGDRDGQQVRSGMRRSGTPLDQVAAGTSAADPAVDAWLEAVRAAFLDAYRAEAASRGLHVDIDRALLHALEVEKELYEFGYAATYLPAWMYAPSAGMRWLLDHLVDA